MSLVLVVLFSAQIMCTSFGSGSPVESGLDASAVDGATSDGPSDAAAEGETSSRRGCAGRDTVPIFCEDFDEEGGTSAFAQVLQLGTGSLDVAFKGGYSPPNAARFVIPASTSDGGCANEVNCEGAQSNIVQTLHGPTSHVRLRFRVLLTSTRTDRIYVFFAKTPDLALNFWVQGNELVVNSGSMSDAGVDVFGSDVFETLPMAKWTDIEVEEKLSSPASVTLRVDGQEKPVALPTAAVIAPSTMEYRLQLGGSYHSASPRPFELLVDDVVVDTLP